eukprot:scaffold2065_cov39-Attheya_sp.AAC.1
MVEKVQRPPVVPGSSVMRPFIYVAHPFAMSTIFSIVTTMYKYYLSKVLERLMTNGGLADEIGVCAANT